MNILFYISVILLAGMAVAKILGYFKFPNVTGYLIAGIIIGPSISGLISSEVIDSLRILSDVALGFIAYSIGSQINIKEMRKTGSGIIVLTFMEALTAMVMVTLVCVFVFGRDLPFSLMLGAISCATAPAATLMVIRQYKASGPLVDVLLPVVALDDVVGIMAFGVASTVAKAILNNAKPDVFSMFLKPLWEIIAALMLGAAIGILFIYISKKIKTEGNYLNLVIAIVFLGVALASKFGLSGLLTLMATGSVISTFLPTAQMPFTVIEPITTPIFLIFFVLSGSDLSLKAIGGVGLIGLAYIVVRVIGKWLGAYAGAKIFKMPQAVQKYLGYTLMPQAGVALGLSYIAVQTVPPPHGPEIRTIILCATVIYELLGPLVAKKALQMAGEIKNN
ncbi:MAG TPA: cation:proton antiporter [Petrotogaceae bacterium]|nr:cation:proton antiporter [Petrotogaceae bacterium]HPX16070.1 cation:proton antiporter [Petrotogaceae bacterium]HQC40209.1 cation:proton antiporter [Petrotogaceae bacterium]HQO12410.1 cation:proton antiporter [Petrotogaceae bacterium]